MKSMSVPTGEVRPGFRNWKSTRTLRVLLPLLACSIVLCAQDHPKESARSVDVQMRNVLFHYTDQVSVHIRTLRGSFVPLDGEIPVFDNKNSFALKILSAEIAITPAS